MFKNILRIGAFLAVVTAGFVSAGIAIGSGGPPQMVTICHAAGQAGTTKFVTLTIPYNAAFGQAGHFGENGTPNAGHEQDYLGACVEDPDPTEPDPTEPDPTEPDPTTPDPTVPDPTVPDPTVPDETVPPPFECPNGEEPIHGVDTSEDGWNDSCDPCAPPRNLEKCPLPETPPAEVTPPVEGATPPVVVTPPTVSEPKPTKPKTKKTAKKKKAKIVSVKPGKKPGTVIIKTSDGETHVGVQGSG